MTVAGPAGEGGRDGAAARARRDGAAGADRQDEAERGGAIGSQAPIMPLGSAPAAAAWETAQAPRGRALRPLRTERPRVRRPLLSGRLAPQERVSPGKGRVAFPIRVIAVESTIVDLHPMIGAEDVVTRNESLPDPLIWLGSRADLIVDLTAAVEPGSPARTLVLFEFAGFGEYVELYGRLEAQALLARLAARLSGAVTEPARYYRPRGDEFAALITTSIATAEPILSAAISTLTDRFEQFRITPSFGAALLPDEASDPVDALMLADRRLFVSAVGRSVRERRLHPANGLTAGWGGRLGPLAGRARARCKLRPAAGALPCRRPSERLSVPFEARGAARQRFTSPRTGS